MQEPKPGRFIKLRVQTDRAAALVKKLAPFIACILVTLLAVFVFNVANPGPKPLSNKDLDQRIAQVMASATPPPAISARVYAAIQPSLVQIETKILSPD